MKDEDVDKPYKDNYEQYEARMNEELESMRKDRKFHKIIQVCFLILVVAVLVVSFIAARKGN